MEDTGFKFKLNGSKTKQKLNEGFSLSLFFWIVVISTSILIELPSVCISLIGIFIVLNQMRKFSALISIKDLINGLFVCVIHFAPFLTLLFFYGGYFYLTRDYRFYVMVSRFIGHYLHENATLDYISFSSSYIPYHYGELWLTGLLSRLTNLNENVAYVVVYAFLTVLIGSFLSSLVGILRPTITGIPRSLAVVCLSFTSAYGWLYPSMGFLVQDIWDISLISAPKLSVIYLILLWSANLIVRKQFGSAFILISILPLLYYSTFFSVLILVGITVFVSWRFNYYIITGHFLIVGFYLLLIGVFYPFYLNINNPGIINVSSYELLSSNSIETMVNILGKTTILVVFTYLPYMFLFAKRSAKLYGLALIFIGLLFLPWMVFYQIVDSVQLWSNFFYPLMFSVIICFGLVLLRSERQFIFFLIICVVSSIGDPNRLGLIARFQKSDELESLSLNRLSYPFKNKQRALILYEKDWSNISSFFEKKANVYPPAPSLEITGSIDFVCINIHEMPRSKEGHLLIEESRLLSTDPLLLLYNNGNCTDVDSLIFSNYDQVLFVKGNIHNSTHLYSLEDLCRDFDYSIIDESSFCNFLKAYEPNS